VNQLFDGTNVLQIDQHKRSWLEMLFSLEQRNQYAISGGGRHRGFAVEQGTAFLDRVKRILLGSHRPLHLLVLGANDQPILSMSRPWYWIFSNMTVSDGSGRVIGSVIKRWGFVTKKYELFEGTRSFANISSGIFKIWTFPVFSTSGQQIATISKKWGGLLKEYISDADKFGVSFDSQTLTDAQKAVIFAAALSIDFDYFENNNKR
jgi:uncharacterized protein YxjI